jgi:hypothetical protein
MMGFVRNNRSERLGVRDNRLENVCENRSEESCRLKVSRESSTQVLVVVVLR